MWEEIFNLAISNGIFAVLFLALLVHVLRDGNAREKKCQDTIERLSNRLAEIIALKDRFVDISNDVEDIKEDITVLISHNSKDKSTKNKMDKNPQTAPILKG